jgi:hypothetical protein
MVRATALTDRSSARFLQTTTPTANAPITSTAVGSSVATCPTDCAVSTTRSFDSAALCLARSLTSAWPVRLRRLSETPAQPPITTHGMPVTGPPLLRNGWVTAAPSATAVDEAAVVTPAAPPGPGAPIENASGIPAPATPPNPAVPVANPVQAATPPTPAAPAASVATTAGSATPPLPPAPAVPAANAVQAATPPRHLSPVLLPVLSQAFRYQIR